MKVLKSKRGVTQVLMLVVTLVAVAILLPIGLILTSQLQTTANGYNLGTSGNSTRTTLFNNIFSAMNLAAISPIVYAAVFIIGIVMTMGAIYYSRRG